MDDIRRSDLSGDCGAAWLAQNYNILLCGPGLLMPIAATFLILAGAGETRRGAMSVPSR